MRRADPCVQDMVDALDDHLEQCGGPYHVDDAFASLGPASSRAIDEEIQRCVNSMRYYMENYHAIRGASGDI